jgi:squalene-hopene/tetraprenyl-beta-curcumene cyclase
VLDRERLERATKIAVDHLLAQRNAAGHWVGELSTSALSTATAVMALHQFVAKATSPAATRQAHACRSRIERGCVWLLAHQNEDGGWGDTTKSFSNISTTMLCHATLVATRSLEADASYTTLAENQIVTRDETIRKAAAYIERAGGVPALIHRYGKDKTFSVPILTHCALAGLVPWNQVPRLPFELACIPANWYAAVRLPVVSYALPALIAIGQVRHYHGPTWNPITRLLRWLARDRSMQVLEKIQPPNGGFLEAAPLTSFVCMSLASMGLTDHPVVTKGIDFLVKSVRPDGSWPIDTNLATWVTTLAVNALGDDLPQSDREPIRKWLLNQQYQVTHPYTNAAPGGWAWTDLPGGVPDADDTPGAILAIERLETRGERLEPTSSSPLPQGEGLGVRVPQRGDTAEATDRAIRWLVDLQNRDGGFPTFCRGWGALPFDRSSPDITAHCIRALQGWLKEPTQEDDPDAMWIYGLNDLQRAAYFARSRAEQFLNKVQRPNGSWLPLWFGNQHVPDDENPVYGTSRVLRAYQVCGLAGSGPAQRGAEWLLSVQNPDGGWGGDKGAPSSVEETALALEALLSRESGGGSREPARGREPAATSFPQPSTLNPQLAAGIEYLIRHIESGTWSEPTPIGFYFAKLWYFEALYPVIWTVAALRKAVRNFNS